MRSELFHSLWEPSRTLAALRRVLDTWGPHPALQRFIRSRQAGQRLLWVEAPAGLGREWFVLSWLASFPRGFILDLSEPLSTDPETVQEIECYLRETPDAAVGIIAAADTEQCLWQSTFNRVTATTADLLLTKSEAAEFYAGLAGRRTGEEAANPPFAKAWRAVGSWLYGLASVQRYGHRATCIRDGMTWLLNNLDSYTGSSANITWRPFCATTTTMS